MHKLIVMDIDLSDDISQHDAREEYNRSTAEYKHIINVQCEALDAPCLSVCCKGHLWGCLVTLVEAQCFFWRS